MRVYVYAHTLMLNRHTRARARPCVHLSTFVSIACEKRREKRSALQRVVQILSDRSRRSNDATRRFRFPCAKRFISRLGLLDRACRRACCDFMKSHLRRGMTRRRVKIPRWNLSRWSEYRIHRRGEFERALI